jgi:hypothetical protein
MMYQERYGISQVQLSSSVFRHFQTTSYLRENKPMQDGVVNRR